MYITFLFLVSKKQIRNYECVFMNCVTFCFCFCIRFFVCLSFNFLSQCFSLTKHKHCRHLLSKTFAAVCGCRNIKCIKYSSDLELLHDALMILLHSYRCHLLMIAPTPTLKSSLFLSILSNIHTLSAVNKYICSQQ